MNPSKRALPTPRIAITAGDVAGVGPELALRCLRLKQVTDRCTPILYGPRNALEKIAQRVDLPPTAEIRDVGEVDLGRLQGGVFSAQTGRASFEAVDRAITDVMAGRADAMVTGPIQKEAWHDAGIPFPGHTELLAQRTGTVDVSMMLTSPEVSCVLVTIHIPLADVAAQLSQSAVLRAIEHAAQAMTVRHRRPARLTVCGLNPHAGEHGLFSHGEEQAIIEPAIQQARAMGIDATGPWPADTAFTPARRRETDAYVCMYHDQGLIPLKTLAFDHAVNVTLGLPIVRTSVDHGTALDLAWQGKANHHSMLAAIELAIELSRDGERE